MKIGCVGGVSGGIFRVVCLDSPLKSPEFKLHEESEQVMLRKALNSVKRWSLYIFRSSISYSQ